MTYVTHNLFLLEAEQQRSQLLGAKPSDSPAHRREKTGGTGGLEEERLEGGHPAGWH